MEQICGSAEFRLERQLPARHKQWSTHLNPVYFTHSPGRAFNLLQGCGGSAGSLCSHLWIFDALNEASLWGCSLLSALCNVCWNDRGSRWQQKSLTNTGEKSSVNKQWHPAEWSGSFHSYVCADMLVKVQYVGKNIKNSYIMHLKELRGKQLRLESGRGYSADIPPPMCSNSTGGQFLHIAPLDNWPLGQWVRVLLFRPFLGGRGRLSPPEHTEERWVIAVLLQNVWNKCVWEGMVKAQFLSKHQVCTSLPPDLKQYWHGGHPLPVWCVLLTRQIYIVNRRYLCWLNTICFLIDCDPRQGWNAALKKSTKPSAAADVCVRKFSIYRNKQILSSDAWVCIDWCRGVTVGSQ